MVIFMMFYLIFTLFSSVENVLFSELFHLNNNGWKIIGNKQGNKNGTDVLFRPFSLNGIMSNYIVGHDKIINVDSKRKDDSELWYFSKNFPTNYSLSNTSIFSFMMTSLAGDFRKLNNENSTVSALIKIINNVSDKHIIFPVHHLIEKYNGTMQTFIIPMVYNVWLNGVNYTQASHRYFLDVLKNVTQIDILGDWTQGNETMCLDNVMIY
jgi:hypothetical protein